MIWSSGGRIPLRLIPNTRHPDRSGAALYVVSLFRRRESRGVFFFGRFFHIILPLSRTGIVTAATFEFLTCWNEFVFANLIVSSEKLRTIQVGIRYFTNQFSTDYVSMYAAIMISIIPSIIGYIIFQEQIISGMTSGAVKG